MTQSKRHSKAAATKSGDIAVIVSPGQAHWGSCHTISHNLRLSYELAERKTAQKFDYINYGDKMSKKDLLALAQEIVDGNYSLITFIDHWPPAFGLVRAMHSVAKGRPLPPIMIHIYGDFTFYSTDMVSTFYMLSGHKVRPVCASHRQLNLVKGLLNTQPDSLGYVPFPVNPKVYYPSEAIRAEERRALGWADDEQVILYTGRISLQKNVSLAITQFFEHIKKLGAHKSKTKYRFALAGKYDDMGAPFFGNSLPKNEYFFRIRQIIDEVDPSLGAISYLGNFEAEKLNRIYNAADGFLSLSLHHDEDYGMSPAEALATGLPSVLSDWGGYSSFADINDINQKRVWLAPVGVDGKGHYFPEPTLDDSLSKLLRIKPSDDERRQTAQRFHDLFSIEAVADKLIQEFSKAKQSVIDGPSGPFLELADRAIKIRNKKMDRIYHSYSDPLYQMIYSPYYGPR